MLPSSEQRKEFWERCGVKPHTYTVYPPIDLNNLFRYAVPFLLGGHAIIETYSFKQKSGLYYSETGIWDKDDEARPGVLKGKQISKAFVQDLDLERANVLSLFWAIDQAFKEER